MDPKSQLYSGSMPNMMTSLHYACILLLPFVFGFIGYDCGGCSLNFITLSLLDIGDCELAEELTNTEETYMQLLQLSDYDRTKIQQCMMEIDHTILYYGMHWHVSAVWNGRRACLQILSNTACQRLRETGILSLGGRTIISEASPNSKVINRINLIVSTK